MFFGSSSKTPAQHPRAKRKLEDVTPAKKLRQTYLDFGQAKFDSTTCIICGMVYTPGLEEAEHIKFCKSKTADLRWTVGKDANVVLDCEAAGVVLAASKSDPRTKRLREYVEEVLGFCEPENFNRATTSFVFVAKSHAIGYLETDPVTSASKALASSETLPVTFGVLKIWVHPNERRKGIATKLLDAARAFHGYPTAVPKQEIAFSPPTSLGRMLAGHYFGTDNFMVYKI